MRAHARLALAFSALALGALGTALPVHAQERPIGELLREINDELARHPADGGAFQVDLLEGGVLEARRTDATGVVERRQIYFEDIASVTQTRRGHVFLVCDEELGDCAKEDCFGEYANWRGCTRAGGTSAPSVRRLSDVLVIPYAYDTRAYRRLETAFEELLAYDLEEISAHADRRERR